MANISSGGGGGGTYSSDGADYSYTDLIDKSLKSIYHQSSSGAGGSTSQGGGGSVGKILAEAEKDQMVGKLGAMIGEWQPEVEARFVEAF